MGIGRACEHHQRTGIPHHSTFPAAVASKGPDKHPVRANWDRRARPIEGIGITVLIRAADHIDETRRGVRGLWLSRQQIHEPLHSHGIQRHGYII
jgi:hypothetical protein